MCNPKRRRTKMACRILAFAACLLGYLTLMGLYIPKAKPTPKDDWPMHIWEHRSKIWPLSLLPGAKRPNMVTQSFQAGAVQFMLDHLPLTNKFCVEIGFPYRKGSNTGELWEQGWKHVQFDGSVDPKGNTADNTHREFVCGSNVIPMFERYNVPENPDYIHVDIDSFDLWVAKSILSSEKFRPMMFSVEYTCDFFDTYFVRADCDTSTNALRGTSFLAVVDMISHYQLPYKLVHVEPCMDMFFIRDDIAAKLEIPPLHYWTQDPHFLEQFIGTVLEHKSSEYSNILDWREYVANGGDVKAAIAANQPQIEPFLRRVTAMMNKNITRVVNPIATPRSPWEQELTLRELKKINRNLGELKRKGFRYFKD